MVKLKTKCPHCGASDTTDSSITRTYFGCGSYVTKGFPFHRSDVCLEREEVISLTEERNAWRNVAIELHDSFESNIIDHPAVALYEAAKEKYGI